MVVCAGRGGHSDVLGAVNGKEVDDQLGDILTFADREEDPVEGLEVGGAMAAHMEVGKGGGEPDLVADGGAGVRGRDGGEGAMCLDEKV